VIVELVGGWVDDYYDAGVGGSKVPPIQLESPYAPVVVDPPMSVP